MATSTQNTLLPTLDPWFETMGSKALWPLVGEASFDRIKTLVGALQMDARMMALECRLAEGDDRTDLALCLHPGTDLSLTRWTLKETPGGTPAALARAVDFLVEWSQGRERSDLPFIWCAFDLDSGSSAQSIPCLSLCVDRSFFARRLGGPVIPGLGVFTQAEIRRLAESLQTRLQVQPLPESVAERLESWIGALDGFGYAKHLSYMLSRSPVTLKLDVCLPLEKTVPFLEKIGWAGGTVGLEAQLRSFMSWEGQVQLNLVLNASERCPLEVEFFTVPGEAALGHRLGFLDHLIRMGLCAPAKADILRQAVLEPMMKIPGFAVSRAWYIKIRFQGGEPLEAKAYLGLKSRRRP